jgi:hypothetical protein
MLGSVAHQTLAPINKTVDIRFMTEEDQRKDYARNQRGGEDQYNAGYISALVFFLFCFISAVGYMYQTENK